MPPGRRIGRGAIADQARRRQAMARQGELITAERAQQMKWQLESFQSKLEQFAIKHKKEIQRDAVFRAKFHTMCASIGVDPLTSRKGIWSELLGVGDYYYELGVRVIEICVATRSINGGIISLGDMLSRLQQKRMTYTEKISSDDVERAVDKLVVLGNGFKMVQVANERMVQSVPIELSGDHTKALGLCTNKGYMTRSQLQHDTSWDAQRVETTIQFLLDHEFAWIDVHAGSEEKFWVLALIPAALTT